MFRRALGGFLFAPVLILGAMVLLFWNEGRAVRTARALNEGARQVVSVEPPALAAQSDGSLVHVVGEATVAAPLIDAELGLSRPALRLIRTVEMHQWRRISRDDDPSYERVWSAEAIDSSAFLVGHQNPGAFPLVAAEQTAVDARLGGFSLSPALLARSRDLQPLLPTAEEMAAMEDRLWLFGVETADGALHLPYGGGSAAHPAIGDLRLRLQLLPTGLVSTVARKSGTVLDPYTSASGISIAFFRSGAHAAQTMFDDAIQQNNAFTVALRGFGFLLTALGFRLLFQPLAALTGWIPLLGGLTGAGLNLLAGGLGLSLSLATASTAWLAYRPLIALPLLLLAAVGVVLLLRRRRPATPPSPAVSAPPA